MKIHNNSNRLYPVVKKNRFYNHCDDDPENLFLHTIPSFVGSLLTGKSQFVNINDWMVKKEPLACSIDPIITWIGHATFLIQIAGLNILTDPIFESPSFIFPRLLPAGIPFEQLPAIDIILLSHNHRDHCDIPTLHMLWQKNKNMVLLVPKGDKYWLEKYGFTVQEFSWWQEFTRTDAGRNLTCTFLPARHWSQHGLFDCNKSLWGSWMIGHEDQLIYFAGDTAYGQHFSIICQEFGAINTALMPIGPCDPDPWMRKSHVDAKEAILGFLDLKATNFIPMHWGTFAFGSDLFHAPVDRLQKAWNLNAELLTDKNLLITKVGQPLLIKQ